MRYIRSAVLTLTALVAVSAPSATTAQEPGTGDIVFIESQRILQAAPGAREAQQTLEQEIGQLRQQVQTMEQTLDSLVTEYDQRQVMLSPEAKRQMEQQIRSTQQQFQARALQLEQQVQQRQTELLQPIMARIQQVIDELREERGYALVLDASSGGIISASAELDITEEVMERLQAAGSGQASAQ